MIVLQNICLNSVKDTKQVLRCEELLEQVFKWCKDRMVVISTEAWNVIHFCLHMVPSSRQQLGESIGEPLVEQLSKWRDGKADWVMLLLIVTEKLLPCESFNKAMGLHILADL